MNISENCVIRRGRDGRPGLSVLSPKLAEEPRYRQDSQRIFHPKLADFIGDKVAEGFFLTRGMVLEAVGSAGAAIGGSRLLRWKGETVAANLWLLKHGESCSGKSALANLWLHSIHERERAGRRIIQDADVPSIISISAKNPRGILQEMDHYLGWAKSRGKRERQAYADRWAGNDADGRISINVSDYPHGVRAMLADADLDFASRFVFSPVESQVLEGMQAPRCHRYAEGEGPDYAFLERAMGILLDLERDEDTPVLAASEEAVAAFDAWLEKAGELETGRRAPFVRRIIEMVPRFALILHYLDWACELAEKGSAPDPDTEINRVDIERATLVADLCLETLEETLKLAWGKAA